LPLSVSNANFWFENQKLETETLNYFMDRPPPYFPQSQLSPGDENRYKKFKLAIGLLIFAAILLLIGAGVGIYYLIGWAFA
jgi:hypothetical protein